MIHYLIGRLEDTAGVTDIVGTNIFTLSRLDNNTVPAVVLQMTGTTDTAETHAFTVGIDTTLVEVTAIATDPGAAWNLAKEIRKSLNGWKDGAVRASAFQTWASDIFEAPELYTITAEYAVQVKI